MHLLDVMQVIDAMDQADCKAVGQRIQARLREIREQDPYVYVVSRSYKEHFGYAIHFKGQTPFMARDLQHSGLVVYNTVAGAAMLVYCKSQLQRGWPGETFQIVPVAKEVFETLPCKKRYDQARAESDRLADKENASYEAWERANLHRILQRRP